MNKVEEVASRQVGADGRSGLAALEMPGSTMPTLCLAQAAEWAVRVIGEARYATRHAAEVGRHHDTGTFTRNTRIGSVAETTPSSFSRLLEQLEGVS